MTSAISKAMKTTVAASGPPNMKAVGSDAP